MSVPRAGAPEALACSDQSCRFGANGKAPIGHSAQVSLADLWGREAAGLACLQDRLDRFRDEAEFLGRTQRPFGDGDLERSPWDLLAVPAVILAVVREALVAEAGAREGVPALVH